MKVVSNKCFFLVYLFYIWLSPMDIRQLRYFIAVAKARSFTLAAKKLHISQPPLSRQIQLLEESLGVTLLSRTSRPLRLTKAGRLFYTQAIQIVNRVEQLKTSTQQLASNQKRSVSIGFVASTLYGGLPVLIRQLRLDFPDVDIQLVELTTKQQIEALKAGRIDVGFGRIRTDEIDIERIVLFEERLMLALPPSSELADNDDPISIQALQGQRLLIYPKEPRPSFADQILSLLDDYRIELAYTHEVRELQSALGLVAAEAGLCLIPASARLRHDIHYRLIKEKRIVSPIILSYRKQDTEWYIQAIRELSLSFYRERPTNTF